MLFPGAHFTLSRTVGGRWPAPEFFKKPPNRQLKDQDNRHGCTWYAGPLLSLNHSKQDSIGRRWPIDR